jgi:hypothetical protein
LYSGEPSATVTVLAIGRRRQVVRVTGEALRRSFERRLDERQPEGIGREAA